MCISYEELKLEIYSEMGETQVEVQGLKFLMTSDKDSPVN